MKQIIILQNHLSHHNCLTGVSLLQQAESFSVNKSQCVKTTDRAVGTDQARRMAESALVTEKTYNALNTKSLV